MVEQEQLSGMDLLMVQQHLLIILPYGIPEQISTMEPKDYAHIPHLVLVLQGLGMT
jgi:hypothetical protein